LSGAECRCAVLFDVLRDSHVRCDQGNLQVASVSTKEGWRTIASRRSRYSSVGEKGVETKAQTDPIAERVAIESRSQIITLIGDKDSSCAPAHGAAR